MNPLQHPSFSQLTDLAEDRVEGEARTALLGHVDACETCGADLRWLDRALHVMRRTALEEPPADTFGRARRLLRQFGAHEQPRAGLLRVVASLLFDSGQASGSLAFGLRAGEDSGQRQFMFGAGDRDLDVRLQLLPDGWSMTGQVLGPCGEGGVVELSGPITRRTVLTEQCEFLLADLTPGTYGLVVRLTDAQIEVEELAVGV